MHRRFVIFLAALALVSAPGESARAASDEIPWTDDDTQNEKKGDVLYNDGYFDGAEMVYADVLADHPNSTAALLYHVKALIALKRFTESAHECSRAIELEPEDARAHEWLGITLAQSGQTREAIDALQKSLALDPDEITASIWLGVALWQDGRQARGDLIFHPLLVGKNRAIRGKTSAQIGDAFYRVDNRAQAVAWNERAADLGSSNGAQWLEWAYGTGYGVPFDGGAGDYWSRRTLDPPFAWFPQLPIADKIDHFARGWLLVLIILLSTFLLPWLTIGIVAWCFRRGVTADPAIHWSERARRSYPFQMLLGFGVIILPGVAVLNAIEYPGFLLPVPKTILLCIVFALGFWTSNIVVVRWARLYRPEAGTALQNIKDIGVVFFIFAPTLVIFMVMALLLPSQWNVEAGLIIAAAVLAYFCVQYGWLIRLGRLLGIIVPADAGLVADTTALAEKLGQPKPDVWMIHWRKSNAFAFPFSNAIVVTKTLRKILTRAEMIAVLAHEMAHLCEDRTTSFLRLFVPLLILPIFTLSLWDTPNFWIGLVASYAVLLIGLVLLRKRARRMEERADTFGKEAEKETGVYPLALAKLYEANFIPAVMPGKRKVHPHLYDRLIAAGITPDYPRPKPPARWGGIAALVMIALTVAGYGAIWLCLF